MKYTANIKEITATKRPKRKAHISNITTSLENGSPTHEPTHSTPLTTVLTREFQQSLQLNPPQCHTIPLSPLNPPPPTNQRHHTQQNNDFPNAQNYLSHSLYPNNLPSPAHQTIHLVEALNTHDQYIKLSSNLSPTIG
jgi:hypothetical protein